MIDFGYHNYDWGLTPEEIQDSAQAEADYQEMLKGEQSEKAYNLSLFKVKKQEAA